MVRRALALGLVGLALALPALSPPAGADHCDTGVVVFARSSLTPALTPHVSNGSLGCPRPIEAAAHEFHPLTDQVYLRANWPFSAGVPDVIMELDGLGFDGMRFRLVRTVHPTGVTYDSQEWLYMPDGTAAVGELIATLHHPNGPMLSAGYHKMGDEVTVSTARARAAS